MSKLRRLKSKKNKRADSRQHHYLEWKRHKAKGRKIRMRWHLRRFEADEKAVDKLNRLIRRERKRLAHLQPKSGTGDWAGCESIFDNEIDPVAERFGIAAGSEKRWETYGNPGSDHYAGNTTAYATDYLTDSNYTFAKAVAAELGGEWSGDYDSFTIERAGNTFVVQGIAGTHGTGPHCHWGIHRA